MHRKKSRSEANACDTIITKCRQVVGRAENILPAAHDDKILAEKKHIFSDTAETTKNEHPWGLCSHTLEEVSTSLEAAGGFKMMPNPPGKKNDSGHH